MTFSIQLTIWLIVCVTGFIAKAWLLAKTKQRIGIAMRSGTDQQFAGALEHVWRNQWMRLTFWALYLLIGIVATLQEPPVKPLPPPTVLDTMLTWGLIAGVIILMAQTINDLIYIIRQERLAASAIDGEPSIASAAVLAVTDKADIVAATDKAALIAAQLANDLDAALVAFQATREQIERSRDLLARDTNQRVRTMQGVAKDEAALDIANMAALSETGIDTNERVRILEGRDEATDRS